MFVEYLSRKSGSIKAWVGKLLMQVVTVMLLVGMTMAGNVQAASSCDVVKSGLVACYPFDGDANDASANGNHGTVNGATLTADRFGKPNSAYQFDGKNNFILVPNSPSLNPERLTVSVWVNPAHWHLGYIVAKDDGRYARQYIISTYNNFHVHQRTINGGFIHYSSKDGLAYNKWYHVVQTYDGQSVKLYIDGQYYPPESNSTTATSAGGNNQVSQQPLRIGIGTLDGKPYFPFVGVIDDISIYNRALTEEEIKKLYQLKDSPLPACEHAVYSVTNNIGKLVIPFVDIPLLNLYTHQPTGELAVFSGELKQVGGSMDFSLVSSKLKLNFLTTAHDPCHALYDETQKTLHAPFVDVGNEVYDVKFQHLKDIPLELGVFHLESYDLVE